MEKLGSILMGLIASLLGLVLIADYTAAQMELPAYLALFTPEQKAYFLGLPSWLTATWGLQATLSLLGGMLLLLNLKSSVLILGFAFLSNAILCAGLMLLTQPPMQSVTGLFGVYIMLSSLALTLLFWLFARIEKIEGRM